MSIGLLEKIKIKSRQSDPLAAASYREALRDAEEFFRLVGSMEERPDTAGIRQKLKTEYLRAANESE